jgi:hypothetical protein
MFPDISFILSFVLSAVFASCLARVMLRFSGAAQNEVFRRYPRWHYLAALILTCLSNDASLPYATDGSSIDGSLVTDTLATSITAACAIDFAGNLELLAHVLADAL